MIFVSVGTHEQQFNRLIKEIDTLVGNEIIKEKVVIQVGFSDFVPKHCKWVRFLGPKEISSLIKEARIVVTHGGPSSFLEVIMNNKVPIVVPRKAEYFEHVNNHQTHFLRKVINKGYPIIKVEDISELRTKILTYREKDVTFSSNNKIFNEKLKKIMQHKL